MKEMCAVWPTAILRTHRALCDPLTQEVIEQAIRHLDG